MSSDDISSLEREDEINPKLIFNALKKNKRLITAITLSGIILSGIIAILISHVLEKILQVGLFLFLLFFQSQNTRILL